MFSQMAEESGLVGFKVVARRYQLTTPTSSSHSTLIVTINNLTRRDVIGAHEQAYEGSVRRCHDKVRTK
jgi:hypothetical protein